MFFSNKTKYIGLEPNKVTKSALSSSETTLVFTQVILRFKYPDELVIQHSLHGFIEAARQSGWAVVIRVSVVLSRFGNRYNRCFLP